MNLDGLMSSLDPNDVGREIYDLIVELFPICRSITGDGVRETFRILGKHIPLEVHEVPTGTQVFDWTVPKEWNIRDAYVKNSRGEKVIDFQKSNLHILNYSVPVHKIMTLDELKEHLFTLPDHPDWIPYKTSYYREKWGFCLSHKEFLALQEGEYEVVIDSTLEAGSLTYGELYLPGEWEKEVLLCTHVCHPSLCNDNLAGVSMLTFAAKALKRCPRKYGYRFIFIPGNIGAIAWLCLNEEVTPRISHGLVVTGVGDPGPMSYKKTRRGNAEIDRIAEHVLKHSGKEYMIAEFSPYGYGERQFCSPGFNLPVGRLCRTLPGEYVEYHTSADNLSFVLPENLGESFDALTKMIFLLEANRSLTNVNQKCEPNLGKRGLYEALGHDEAAMLWVLNLSDGKSTLLEIAERSQMMFQDINAAAGKLVEQGLLRDDKSRN